MKKRYRVVEFANVPEGEKRFFLQIGEIYWERRFLGISFPSVDWVKYRDPQDEAKIHAGFETMKEAIDVIKELKKSEPVYHNF